VLEGRIHTQCVQHCRTFHSRSARQWQGEEENTSKLCSGAEREGPHVVSGLSQQREIMKKGDVAVCPCTVRMNQHRPNKEVRKACIAPRLLLPTSIPQKQLNTTPNLGACACRMPAYGVNGLIVLSHACMKPGRNSRLFPWMLTGTVMVW